MELTLCYFKASNVFEGNAIDCNTHVCINNCVCCITCLNTKGRTETRRSPHSCATVHRKTGKCTVLALGPSGPIDSPDLQQSRASLVSLPLIVSHRSTAPCRYLVRCVDQFRLVYCCKSRHVFRITFIPYIQYRSPNGKQIFRFRVTFIQYFNIKLGYIPGFLNFSLQKAIIFLFRHALAPEWQSVYSVTHYRCSVYSKDRPFLFHGQGPGSSISSFSHWIS